MQQYPEDNCAYKVRKPLLPFIPGPICLCIGFYFLFWHFAAETYRYLSYRNAIEIPVAEVIQVKLDRSSSSKGGAASTVIASFDYDFEGHRYTSHTPSIYQGGDNFGSFQKDLFTKIQSFAKQGGELSCFVRTSSPDSAVINRDFRPSRFLISLLFCTAFLGLGGVLTYSSAKG
ncbi:DUF3592 domain-containing protein [Persicirhabdus sediminis]|uniref:DUF3592 domain-containing protein n=1 Tax=Persicirhabdus sediminis TaxID=454144 RepID=A0A8J7MGU6_9BACT|nr:DUF3592 domain-containing protein [Persicirhabdus sediminis]MBK1792662.1 DUF3592 domain-containing protein [Persicirhabdus sediminis]